MSGWLDMFLIIFVKIFWMTLGIFDQYFIPPSYAFDKLIVKNQNPNCTPAAYDRGKNIDRCIIKKTDFSNSGSWNASKSENSRYQFTKDS